MSYFNLQTFPKSQLAIRLFFELVSSTYPPNSPAVKRAAKFCDNLLNPEVFTVMLLEETEMGPYTLALDLYNFVIDRADPPEWFRLSGATFTV